MSLATLGSLKAPLLYTLDVGKSFAAATPFTRTRVGRKKDVPQLHRPPA